MSAPSSEGGSGSSLRRLVSSLGPSTALALGVALSVGSTLLVTALKRRLAARVVAESETEEETDAPPPLEPATTRATAAGAGAPARKKSPLPPAPPRVWSEDEFKHEATQFLELLGSSGVLSPERESSLRVALKPAMGWGHDSRALGAHFLLATNAHHLTQSNTEAEFLELMNKQTEDMQLAWELLDCDVPSESELRSLNVMRLQVAQCLKSASLMLPIFSRMMSRPVSDLSDDELILLFTAAPLLGRWSDTVRLGDALGAKHDLSDFHNAPMDYQVLYELAKEEQARGDAPPEHLQWNNFRIVGQRLRLRSASCAEPAVLQSLEAEFGAAGERSWKDVSVADDTRMVRCGALAQLRSFSPVPLALVGPASDDRLLVRGWATPAFKQTESYSMRRVERSQMGEDLPDDLPADAQFWRGEYVMKQEPPSPEEGGMGAMAIPTLDATFDLEMIVVPLPAF